MNMELRHAGVSKPEPLLNRIGEKREKQPEDIQMSGRGRNRGSPRGVERVQDDAEDENDRRIYTPWCEDLNIQTVATREIAYILFFHFL